MTKLEVIFNSTYTEKHNLLMKAMLQRLEGCKIVEAGVNEYNDENLIVEADDVITPILEQLADCDIILIRRQ